MTTTNSKLTTFVATIALLATLFSIAVPMTQAAEMKPVAVMELAAYDHLRSDIDFLGQISGNPGLVQGLDGLVVLVTNLQGLTGLDKNRPLGAVLRVDGHQVQPLVFVPVTSTKELLGVLSGLVGQPEELDEGHWKLKRERVTVYIREQNGWAFLAMSDDNLSDLPKDPLKLLGDLHATYDVAARVFVQNIPLPLREKALERLQQRLKRRMERETADNPEQQAKRSERAVRGLATAFKEIDQITLGFSLDSKEHRALLDVAVNVIPGGKLANHFQEVAKQPNPSRMVGFLVPEALFRLHLNSTATEDDIDAMLAVVDQAHDDLLKTIEGDDDLDAGGKKLMKQLLEDTHEVVVATISKGKFNGGLAVTGEGPFKVALGLGVTDGRKLEGVTKQLLNLAQLSKMAADGGDEKKSESFPEIKFDIGDHQGVNFHELSIQFPEHEVEPRKLLGDKLVITLGFGPETVYVALGQDGQNLVKQILDQSGKSAALAEQPLPFELSLGLEQVLGFASQQEPGNRILQKVVESLQESGEDRIKFSTRVIENGVLARLELEEGLLKLLGVATKARLGTGGL